MKFLSFVAIALVLGVAGLSPGRALAHFAQPFQPSQPAEPAGGPAVIQAWVDALDSHDLDAALMLLADESFLILDSSTGDYIDAYAGKAEIGEWLQVYLSDNVRVRLERVPSEENGTTFWSESRTSAYLTRLGIPVAEYTGQALVNEGKIASLIYTPTPETEAAIARALGMGSEPMGMPKSGAPEIGWVGWATWIAIGLWSLLAGICLLRFKRDDGQGRPA